MSQQKQKAVKSRSTENVTVGAVSETLAAIPVPQVQAGPAIPMSQEEQAKQKLAALPLAVLEERIDQGSDLTGETLTVVFENEKWKEGNHKNFEAWVAFRFGDKSRPWATQEMQAYRVRQALKARGLRLIGLDVSGADVLHKLIEYPDQMADAFAEAVEGGEKPTAERVRKAVRHQQDYLKLLTLATNKKIPMSREDFDILAKLGPDTDTERHSFPGKFDLAAVKVVGLPYNIDILREYSGGTLLGFVEELLAWKAEEERQSKNQRRRKELQKELADLDKPEVPSPAVASVVVPPAVKGQKFAVAFTGQFAEKYEDQVGVSAAEVANVLRLLADAIQNGTVKVVDPSTVEVSVE